MIPRIDLLPPTCPKTGQMDVAALVKLVRIAYPIERNVIDYER
jgi:hypothetical protein